MLSALNDGGRRSKVLLTRLADQPKSPAIIGIAEVLCQQGHYGEAITRLRSVEELYGDVYRFNLVLARACHQAGKVDAAKQYYEKACQVAPQNEVAIRELIALSAFPHTVQKPPPPQQAVEIVPPTLSESKEYRTQGDKFEIPSTFKLDTEKLSKALSGILGGAKKNEDTATTQPTTNPPNVSPAVVEAFRKTESLLEGKPDIDTLAREIIGDSAITQETNEAKSNLADNPEKTLSESVTLNQPDLTSLHQRHTTEVDTKREETSTSEMQVASAKSTSEGSNRLSFEEEAMGMHIQNTTQTTTNEDITHQGESKSGSHTSATPPVVEDEIDALAREIMKAQMPKVIETNDPTPLSEQRQPFSDDDEIKTPTRQLAKIFQSQGAYTKAIKVYEMLAEREPENASLYDILINELREKIKAQK